MGLICQPSKFYISNTSAALISHSANPLIYGTKVILFSCLPWLDFLSPFYPPFPSPALLFSPFENVLYAAFRQASKSANNNLWFPEKPEEWKKVGPEPPFTSPRISRGRLCAALAGQRWAEWGLDGTAKCRRSMALEPCFPKFYCDNEAKLGWFCKPYSDILRTANGLSFVWMEKAGRLISELRVRRYLQVPLNSRTCSRSQSKRVKRVVYSHWFFRLPEPACSHPTALRPWGKDRRTALTQEPEGEKAILGLFTQKPLGIFWVILTFPLTRPLKPEHHESLFCPLG